MSSATFFTLAAIAGCGGKSLDPVTGADTGGSAGKGATGGTGGTSSGGTSSGGTSSGGTGGSGAIGGAGGSGGGVACSQPNPAGCVQTGCSVPGEICETAVTTCKSSSCTCDTNGNDTWVCDPDCGGGICVPDPKQTTYAVRIGFSQGQEATGDFCVAYQTTSAGEPIWESTGLLASNGLTPKEVNGMKQITRYIALSGKPIAFGKSYQPDCSFVVRQALVTGDGKYFTVISVPFSNEPDELWLLNDPGPSDKAFVGVRIVNATLTSYPIDVTIDGNALGTFQFGNSPAQYTTVGALNHVLELKVESPGFGSPASIISWAGVDLLPMISTTIYIGGMDGAYTALGCFDAKAIESNVKWSPCWFMEAQK